MHHVNVWDANGKSSLDGFSGVCTFIFWFITPLAANIAYKSDRIQRLDVLKNGLGVPIEFTRCPTLNFNLLEKTSTFKLITFPYTIFILYSPRLKLVSVERSSLSG